MYLIADLRNGIEADLQTIFPGSPPPLEWYPVTKELGKRARQVRDYVLKQTDMQHPKALKFGDVAKHFKMDPKGHREIAKGEQFIRELEAEGVLIKKAKGRHGSVYYRAEPYIPSPF